MINFDNVTVSTTPIEPAGDPDQAQLSSSSGHLEVEDGC